MPTSWPSAYNSGSVRPSPLSRSPAGSSAARRMIRSSAPRSMRGPEGSDPVTRVLRRLPHRRRCGARERGAGGRRKRGRLLTALLGHLQERRDQIERHRDDDAPRVVLRRDLHQRLQVPQLQRRRLRPPPPAPPAPPPPAAPPPP